jgi:hypothetical protein
MKLCVDCKYYLHTSPATVFEALFSKSHCMRSADYVVTDPILGLGRIEGEIHDCYAEREDALRLEEFRCGKEGKYWEPK